ncbi:class I SAM-dependent methyltransferase [Halanaerobaculum tunisiense]
MEFYQQFSQYYDAIFPFKEVKYNLLSSCLPESGKVLDVATGTGTYAVALAEAGYQVTGIDLSQAMITEAKQKFTSEEVTVDFKVADMREVDQTYEARNFALISCIGNSLVHLEGIEEIKKVLNKFYKLLVTEGKLVLQIVNYNRIVANKVTKLPTINNQEAGVKLTRDYEFKEGKVDFITNLETPEGEFFNSVLLYPLQAEELREALAEAGFTELNFYGGFDRSDYDSVTSFPLVVVANK